MKELSVEFRTDHESHVTIYILKQDFSDPSGEIVFPASNGVKVCICDSTALYSHNGTLFVYLRGCADYDDPLPTYYTLKNINKGADQIILEYETALVEFCNTYGISLTLKGGCNPEYLDFWN